jgi:hypothetical protein
MAGSTRPKGEETKHPSGTGKLIAEGNVTKPAEGRINTDDERKVTEYDEGKVKCPYCAQEFNGKNLRLRDALRCHIGNMHFRKELMAEWKRLFHENKCKECGKFYKDKTPARKHLLFNHTKYVKEVLDLTLKTISGRDIRPKELHVKEIVTNNSQTLRVKPIKTPMEHSQETHQGPDDRKESINLPSLAEKRKAEGDTNGTNKKSNLDTVKDNIDPKHFQDKKVKEKSNEPENKSVADEMESNLAETENLCAEIDNLVKIDINEVKIKLESTVDVVLNSEEGSDNDPESEFVELYKSFDQVKESLNHMNTISDQINDVTGDEANSHLDKTNDQIENNEVMDIQDQLMQIQDISSDEDEEEDEDRMQKFVDEELGY